MLEPSIWYAQQDLSQHYMRDTSRPFEEGVSRGQLRRIAKCEKAKYRHCRSALHPPYKIVVDNRYRKGREYGMKDYDLLDLAAKRDSLYCFGVSDFKNEEMIAAAICVVVAPTVLYTSAWADIEGVEHLSPVTLLCKGIYEWCAANGFTTLDIGIGGDKGLNDFKERLGFRRAK